MLGGGRDGGDGNAPDAFLRRDWWRLGARGFEQIKTANTGDQDENREKTTQHVDFKKSEVTAEVVIVGLDAIVGKLWHGKRETALVYTCHFFATVSDQTMYQTDDLRIRNITEVRSPRALHEEIPLSAAAATTVYNARQAIQNILHGQSDRLLVVVGPRSVHDPLAALEYAQRLQPLCRDLRKHLQLVMRVYFEKPRTTVGWKGLINDPNLDGSFAINSGLAIARKLLLDVNEMGIPAGTEFLDLISPQYIADQVSWGAIGARTTESQGHRELASGLSCPIGFKNATTGDVRVAIDAIHAAARPACLYVGDERRAICNF